MRMLCTPGPFKTNQIPLYKLSTKFNNDNKSIYSSSEDTELKGSIEFAKGRVIGGVE